MLANGLRGTLDGCTEILASLLYFWISDVKKFHWETPSGQVLDSSQGTSGLNMLPKLVFNNFKYIWQG